MSLLDLHAEDLAAATPRYIKPPTPEARTNWGAIATAVPRGVGEATAQVMASGFELAAGARYMRDTPASELKGGGVPASALQSDFADSLREYGRSLRPDAQTANTAEQLLYGFARGASKIVGGALAGGVVGVVAAGGEEAMSAASDLQQQGVGLDARTRAGLVQGAGLGLAALPLVGTSLTATAGLYLAGGPGGYMAQQSLTRQILQGAGYEKQAQQFDPFDPVGLAVSALVPLPFVAVGVRGQRAAAAAKAAEDLRAGPMPSDLTAGASAARQAFTPEVVDAAHVAYAVEQRAASNRAPVYAWAADSHEAALSRAEAAMGIGQAVHVSDLVPPRPIESLQNFMARTKIKDDPLPADVPGDFLGFLRSAGGVDFKQKLDITGEPSGVLANPGGIFRKGGRQTDELAQLAVEAGYLRPGSDSYQLVELVQDAVRGNRVLTMAEQMDKAGRDQHMQHLEQRVQDAEARLQLLGVDPKEAGGNLAAMEAYVREHEPRLLAASLDEARAVNETSAEFEVLQDKARQIAQDIADTGRTLPQFEAELQPLSPVMRRLVQEAMARAPEPTQAPNLEAAASARGAGQAAAEPGIPKPGPAADAAQAAGVAARLAQIEAQFPNLMVRMDGDEKARPLSQFLADAQREADDLQADAPLVQALAECALLNGFT